MTHSCWQVLDLDRESDTSTIKRRYAQLLKVTRPDEDPQAFQRLRDAYETALGLARAVAQPKLSASDPVPDWVASEASLQAAAVAVTVSDHAWLQQVFAELSLEQLDAHLATARERDCLTLFEQRLLHHCLAAGTDADAYVEWALAQLNWLSPWQSLVLPEWQIEQLAEQLLHARIAALAAQLDAGDEAAAQQGLTALWQSRWLQSLDRQALAKEALVEWLAEDENRTPTLVDQLFTLLNVDGTEASDYRQSWAWERLLHYREGQRLLQRLHKYLAMVWPVREEEQAAWLLLKGMSAGDGRHLADNATPRVWQACMHLEHQLQVEYRELLPQLCPQGPQNWRQWLARAEGRWVKWWLALVVILASALPGLQGFTNGAPLPLDPINTALAFIGAGIVMMLVLRWCGRGLDSVARHFAVADGGFSDRLLPTFMVNGGAGFLLLRHGLPCLLLGLFCAAWAGTTGSYSWTYGATVTLASALYALGHLRREALVKSALVRHLCDVWEHSRAVVTWTVLGTVILLGLVARGQQLASTEHSGAKQPCANKTGYFLQQCQSRQVQLGD